MIKEEIKQKEDRLGELYLAYYRMFMDLNKKTMELEKLRVELTQLADEIEQNYLDLSKEKEHGEELCECK